MENHSVCAVIVTHKPDEGLPLRIERIAHQVGHVIIVDNKSPESCLKTLNEIRAYKGTQVIVNDQNIGLAKASNSAVELARKLRYAWILVLDQDSIPDGTMVEELLSAYEDYPNKAQIGLIAANPIDGTTGYGPYDNACRGTRLIEQKVVIASGSLLSVQAYNKVGPFREDFFIDGIDQEYCLRLRHNGYRVFTACRARLTHNLGRPVIHKFLWRNFVPTNHSHIRRYYMARNKILIAKIYYRQEPLWVFLQFISLLKASALIVFFEKEKLKKLKSTLIGLWHGLIGRSGQYRSDAPVAAE